MIAIKGEVIFPTQEDLVRRAWDWVVTAATITRNRAVHLVSRQATRIRVKRKRTTSKGKKGTQYTKYIGSQPGEPPKARRNFGRKQIAIEFEQPQLTARLGVRQSAVYMIYLELGTKRIAPRPWLTRAAHECKHIYY